MGIAGEPKVGADGMIYQNDRQVGSLGLFEADISKGYLRYETAASCPRRHR